MPTSRTPVISSVYGLWTVPAGSCGIAATAITNSPKTVIAQFTVARKRDAEKPHGSTISASAGLSWPPLIAIPMPIRHSIHRKLARMCSSGCADRSTRRSSVRVLTIAIANSSRTQAPNFGVAIASVTPVDTETMLRALMTRAELSITRARSISFGHSQLQMAATITFPLLDQAERRFDRV